MQLRSRKLILHGISGFSKNSGLELGCNWERAMPEISANNWHFIALLAPIIIRLQNLGNSGLDANLFIFS
jgi:hypothetical protein